MNKVESLLTIQFGIFILFCTDVNECEEMNGGCEQICVNSEGSFQCVCNLGFQLAEDGQTCLDGGEFLFL